jgi:hypothetical protein
MKETFYFSHDYNARNDAKVVKLLIKHGFEGYGLYWAIIEDLYQNANALPLDYESIAYALRADSEKIKSIIHGFDLFVFSEDKFGSMSVQRRMEERQLKSKKASDNAFKRWNKYATAMQSDSDRNATALKNDAKKESIVKDIKVKEKKESIKVEPIGSLSELEKTLESFFEMRRKIKKPATPYAKTLILKELEKLALNDDSLKIAILNQSIRNSWQDVYPLKTDARNPKKETTPITDNIDVIY